MAPSESSAYGILSLWDHGEGCALPHDADQITWTWDRGKRIWRRRAVGFHCPMRYYHLIPRPELQHTPKGAQDTSHRVPQRTPTGARPAQQQTPGRPPDRSPTAQQQTPTGGPTAPRPALQQTSPATQPDTPAGAPRQPPRYLGYFVWIYSMGQWNPTGEGGADHAAVAGLSWEAKTPCRASHRRGLLCKVWLFFPRPRSCRPTR